MLNIKGTIPDERLASVSVMQEAKEGYYDVEIPSGGQLVSLHGYFQSHKYFFSHNNELRKIMKVRPSILNSVRAACPEVNLFNTLGIHVRRTDFLNYPDLYRVLGSDYYNEAFKMLHYTVAAPLDAIIIVSDDKIAAKELLQSAQNLQLFGNVPIIISPFSDPTEDLVLLSLCKNLIIANSSFSWWAAYFNMLQFRNGTVIAPSPWYKANGGLSHLNRLDFYLPHWRIIHSAAQDS